MFLSDFESKIPGSVFVASATDRSSEIWLTEVPIIERCLAQPDVVPTLQTPKICVSFNLKITS